MIAAQQYYIDYGPEMSIDRLNSLMPSYIPDNSLQGMKALNFWTQGTRYLCPRYCCCCGSLNDKCRIDTVNVFCIVQYM